MSKCFYKWHHNSVLCESQCLNHNVINYKLRQHIGGLFVFAMMKRFSFAWSQFKVTVNVRSNLQFACVDSSPVTSPLIPCLFAIHSTSFCASAFCSWALRNLQYLLLIMCQIQLQHESKKKTQHFCLFVKQNSLLPFPREKVFCSNLETNIQSVKYIRVYEYIECDTQSSGNVDVWCIVFIPKQL